MPISWLMVRDVVIQFLQGLPHNMSILSGVRWEGVDNLHAIYYDPQQPIDFILAWKKKDLKKTDSPVTTRKAVITEKEDNFQNF